MSTFGTVADGLVVRVKTITSLAQRCDNYPNPNPNPPWAVVVPNDTVFDQDHGGLVYQNWIVRVLCGRGDDRSAASRLYAYLDPSGAESIKAAIEGDKTLGGAVQDAWVQSFDEPQILQYGSGLLLGVDFNVITTTNT